MRPVASDSLPIFFLMNYAYAHVSQGLQKIVVDHRIDWIIHFSALLSAIGEQNVPLAVR